MFGGAHITADSAASAVRERGCKVFNVPTSTSGELAKLGYEDRGVHFFLTLGGSNSTVEALTFYTQAPAESKFELLNDFNASYRFSKAYVKDKNTCLTMSIISPTGKFPADYFGKALALWELALPKFGEMIAKSS